MVATALDVLAASRTTQRGQRWGLHCGAWNSYYSNCHTVRPDVITKLCTALWWNTNRSQYHRRIGRSSVVS